MAQAGFTRSPESMEDVLADPPASFVSQDGTRYQRHPVTKTMVRYGDGAGMADQHMLEYIDYLYERRERR